MQPLTLYLIRHGETDWNASKLIMGQVDIPLNTTGRTQAELLAQRFQSAGITFDALYCSDLSRAAETARIIAARLDCPVFAERGFREIYMGLWQGLHTDEVKTRYPEEAPRFNDPSSMRGEGESSTLVRLRVERSLAGVLQRYPSGTLGIVTHGEPFRVLAGLGCRARYDGPYPWLTPANTGVQVVYRNQQGWTLGTFPEPENEVTSTSV